MVTAFGSDKPSLESGIKMINMDNYEARNVSFVLSRPFMINDSQVYGVMSLSAGVVILEIALPVQFHSVLKGAALTIYQDEKARSIKAIQSNCVDEDGKSVHVTIMAGALRAAIDGHSLQGTWDEANGTIVFSSKLQAFKT